MCVIPMFKVAIVSSEASILVRELKELMGKEWVMDCLSDEACLNTIIDIAETTAKHRASTIIKKWGW